jgi:hydroxylamine reductase (hybrid-cluster protein)
MFCYQCEQAKNNVGCTKVGVCGKTDQVANQQDLLIFQLKVSFSPANHKDMQCRDPLLCLQPCACHAVADVD